MQSNYSNYPFGFDNGLLVKDQQVNLTAQSTVYWVGNNLELEVNERTASNSNKGTFLAPFATLQHAINQCQAGNQNTIYVRAGYDQLISTAGGLTIDVEGINIIGLGDEGAPTFEIAGDVASILISANDVSFTGMNIACSGNPGPINAISILDATGVNLDVNVRSGNALNAGTVIGVKSCETLRINAAFDSISGFNSAVQMDACIQGWVNPNFSGNVAVAVVNFVTDASSNIQIHGYTNVSSVSDGSRNVIDTIGGSNWFAVIEDARAGTIFIGGSGSPLAPIPSSTSITSVINNSERCVTRTTGNLPQSVAGNIFTVTGAPIQIVSLFGVVTNAIQNQANNTKLQITDGVSSTTTDICAVVDIANAALGSSFHITGTVANAMIVTAGGTSIYQAGGIFCTPGTIKVNCAASNTGQVQWYLRYKPLGSAAVVAAA